MKKVVMSLMIGLMSVWVFCLAAVAQTPVPASAAAQDLMIKSEVETAVSMLEVINAKYKKGEMNIEQAKKLGADLLREMKYGKDGYFWADMMDGTNVVLYGRKDVEGKNRLNDKDSQGTYYIKEFLARAKAGGGYIDYLFPKKGQTKAQAKRAYVMPFKPFGWAVGCGYYK